MAVQPRAVPLPVPPRTYSPIAHPVGPASPITISGPIAVSGPIAYRPPIANPVQPVSRLGGVSVSTPTPRGIPARLNQGLFA